MKSIIRIKEGFDLIEHVAIAFNTVSRDNTVNLPLYLGSGNLKGLYFPSDLSLYVGQHRLNIPLQVETINETDSKLFCIYSSITSNKITFKTEGEWRTMDHNGPNSLLFYSSGSSVKIAYPENESFRTIAITFTSKTISDIIDQPDILKGMNPQSSFLYLDETVPEAESLLRQLACIGDEGGPSRFDVYLALLKLLRLTLYRTFIIKERYNSSGLLKVDVEKLFAIRRRLMETSHLTPKIAELSAEFGMGQSKMTKLFKQVFNRTMYKYVQKAKIIKAKDLLNSKKYTVSEAGYMVGYSNMTHFAKAFKKYYKVNPGEYLKELLNTGNDK